MQMSECSTLSDFRCKPPVKTINVTGIPQNYVVSSVNVYSSEIYFMWPMFGLLNSATDQHMGKYNSISK